MLARETEITVIDFETTGCVPGFPDDPWQLGLVTVRRGVVIPDSACDILLRVGDRPFSRHVPGRYALIRAELAQAPRLPELWGRLAARLAGVPLGAHHAATERKQLRRAFPLHRFGPWLDTLALARLAYPDLPSHQLADVLAALGLTGRVTALSPGRAAHDALYDAMGAAVLLEHILALDGWEGATVAGLAAARPGRFHAGVAARNRGRGRGPGKVGR